MMIFNSYRSSSAFLWHPYDPPGANSCSIVEASAKQHICFLTSKKFYTFSSLLLSLVANDTKNSVPGNRSSSPSSNWKWWQCSYCWRGVLQEQWLQGELGRDWLEIIVLMINIAEDLQCRESWQWVLVPSWHPSFPRGHEVLELLPEKDHRIPGDPSKHLFDTKKLTDMSSWDCQHFFVTYYYCSYPRSSWTKWAAQLESASG